MSIHLLGALLFAWMILFSGRASAESGKVQLLVSPGISEDGKLTGRLALLLARLGAPIEPVEASHGQVTHVMDGPGPACSLTILRAPGRERFRWIARSATDTVVIASPSDAGAEFPAPGEYVAAFYAKAMLDAADRLGLKVIPVYNFDQISMILRSGRTRFVLALKTQIEHFNEAQKADLVVTRSIGDVVTWVACNGNVKEAVAGAIGDVWRKAYQDGELQRIYAENGMEKILPSP